MIVEGKQQYLFDERGRRYLDVRLRLCIWAPQPRDCTGVNSVLATWGCSAWPEAIPVSSGQRTCTVCSLEPVLLTSGAGATWTCACACAQLGVPAVRLHQCSRASAIGGGRLSALAGQRSRLSAEAREHAARAPGLPSAGPSNCVCRLVRLHLSAYCELTLRCAVLRRPLRASSQSAWATATPG